MKETITYLALGDSYTIGEGVLPEERWPVQLAQALQQSGMNVLQPEIVATTGWTTGELKAGIAAALEKEYGLVSLLIGVNNQYRGLDTSSFREEFSGLLQEAVRFAGGNTSRVFVVSIPDWGVTPFAKDRNPALIAAQIDALNTIVREESEKQEVLFVDITPLSRRAESNPTLLAADSLHPSGSMYTLWTEEILPPLLKRLK